MIKGTCIEKIKLPDGTIQTYYIELESGKIVPYCSFDLKVAICDKRIEIQNLKLTSNYRLIDYDPNKKKSDNTEDKLIKWVKKLADTIINKSNSGQIKKLDFKPGCNCSNAMVSIYGLKNYKDIALNICVQKTRQKRKVIGNIANIQIAGINEFNFQLYGPHISLGSDITTDSNIDLMLEQCKQLLNVYKTWKKYKDSDTVYRSIYKAVYKCLKHSADNEVPDRHTDKYLNVKEISIHTGTKENNDKHSLSYYKRFNNKMADEPCKLMLICYYNNYNSGFIVANRKGFDLVAKKLRENKEAQYK